ncbi:MAG: 2-succinyl-5-enolpyruvyl-6-hydroxy-3-cyclohexene-1-carboxylic-acid synthase [Ferruginibacter sp.]|nr:2-succinyl-5-enolpyruvyl-6-hydroxy-3-cyclohexene-1-carboxylic-acid synthase [Cytophagales bacterium]
MAILQPLVNLAEICARQRVQQVILSPGSRCAPLTLAFVRHPQITTRSIPDERSAAFIALGLAQKTGATVALVCTSGTAVLNYGPAVAEAFFQQIPLLIFTADRPAEWIAQQDGQTIYQRGAYGRHVKESYELPADYTHPDAAWHVERVINEAIHLSQTTPKGPVHVNVPIREPFYPGADETLAFDRDVRLIERMSEERILTRAQWRELTQGWENSDQRLVVAGQQAFQPDLLNALRPLLAEGSVPVVGDLITNLYPLADTIRHQDIFLGGLLDNPGEAGEKALAALQPDLLITFGQSVLSKNLKRYLRKYPPYQHWHLQPAGPVADSFQTVTRVVPVEPLYFFRALLGSDFRNQRHEEESADPAYFRRWRAHDEQAGQRLFHFLRQPPFQEFAAVGHVLEALPDNGLLHLANSMPVRYANYLSLAPGKNTEVFANRGTSGIDGSTSTAVGCALATEAPLTLLTGDVAFFYDRNALWNNYLPPNLRIVLLNNHGGNIFRLLDGPGQQPELDEYFETRQLLNARHTAQDAGMDYAFCDNEADLLEKLPAFFSPEGQARLLEIKTDAKVNAEVFRAFKATW